MTNGMAAVGLQQDLSPIQWKLAYPWKIDIIKNKDYANFDNLKKSVEDFTYFSIIGNGE